MGVLGVESGSRSEILAGSYNCAKQVFLIFGDKGKIVWRQGSIQIEVQRNPAGQLIYVESTLDQTPGVNCS